MPYKWFADKTNQQVFWLLLGGLLFRLGTAFFLYPGLDEAYYYLYTTKLDWSYFDHPPLVAFTTGFGIWLTGDVSQFTIRLGTVILYTGTLIFMYLTSARLFSRPAAILTLAIATLAPFFPIAFGTLNLPDCPLIFFWTAALYCAACEFFDRQDSYRPSYRLAIMGLLVGLACLGKYHGFLLGLGIIGFCLSSPHHRSAFKSPWILLGLGLFLVTISPVLWWNMQHEWISFRFQSMRAVPSSGLNLIALLLTFLVGIGYLFPTFGLPLWWVSLRALLAQITQRVAQRLPLNEGKFWEKQLLILWVSVPIFLGFTLMGVYRQVLPSWPMPGFWGATLLLGQQAAIWQMRSPQTIRRWLQGSGIVITSILLFALLHVTLGTLQKPSTNALFGGFVPANADDSTQLIDIQQLRQGFAKSPVLSAALEKSSFVFTQYFFVGGHVAMALTPLSHKPVTTFDEDLRGFAFWSRADEWLGKDALYVTSEYFQKQENMMDKYGKYFQSIEKIGDVPIRRGGEIVQVFNVYQAKKLLKPYPRPYGI